MKGGIILLLLITTVHSFLSVPTAQKVPESDFYHHPKVRHEKAKEQKYGTQSRPLSFQNLVFEGLVKYLYNRQSFRTRRIKPIICTYSMAIPVIHGKKIEMKTIEFARSQTKKMKMEQIIAQSVQGPLGFLLGPKTSRTSPTLSTTPPTKISPTMVK